jgi:hypothetical protein
MSGAEAVATMGIIAALVIASMGVIATVIVNTINRGDDRLARDINRGDERLAGDIAELAATLEAIAARIDQLERRPHGPFSRRS